MRRMIPAAAVSVFFIMPTASGFVLDDAREACRAEWPADFQMQEYCIRQQERAFKDLGASHPDLPAEHRDAILTFCYSNWPTDATMIRYCLRQQEKAAGEIATPLIDQGVDADAAAIIERKCKTEWLPDLTMVAYCRKQQADAWLRLNEPSQGIPNDATPPSGHDIVAELAEAAFFSEVCPSLSRNDPMFDRLTAMNNVAISDIQKGGRYFAWMNHIFDTAIETYIHLSEEKLCAEGERLFGANGSRVPRLLVSD